jgi:hypothetical protein
MSAKDIMASHWPGKLQPTELLDARVQLHWAAQVLSGAADRWLPSQADDSHTNMAWLAEAGVLIGNAMPSGLRLALAPLDFELRALHGDREVAAIALTGRTLSDAMQWADAQIASVEGGPPRAIRARDYEMPAHAVRAAGAAFSPDRTALAELAGWFTHADLVLREVAARERFAVPVRIWPHHFDVGSIIFLDEPGTSSRQIGFGLSPGDHYYEQPYFYVSAFPLPSAPRFPPLPADGFWRDHPPFVGAVLLGSSIGVAADPLTASRSFLEAAVAASRTLIGG